MRCKSGAIAGANLLLLAPLLVPFWLAQPGSRLSNGITFSKHQYHAKGAKQRAPLFRVWIRATHPLLHLYLLERKHACMIASYIGRHVCIRITVQLHSCGVRLCMMPRHRSMPTCACTRVLMISISSPFVLVLVRGIRIA